MDTDVNIFIQQVEDEIAALRVDIERCLLEHDYKYAKYNQRAIDELIYTLTVVKSLTKNNYI